MNTRWMVAVAAGAALAACGAEPTPPPEPGHTETAAAQPTSPLEPSEPFGQATLVLRSPDGDTEVPLTVYDAFAPDARSHGLMWREDLPDETGMVFRFPRPAQGGFWMRNTLIPLSIAFFDEAGEVLATRDMAPCPADPCPTYDPGVLYSGALEVEQGFFDQVGLGAGWRVELPAGLPDPL